MQGNTVSLFDYRYPFLNPLRHLWCLYLKLVFVIRLRGILRNRLRRVERIVLCIGTYHFKEVDTFFFSCYLDSLFPPLSPVTLQEKFHYHYPSSIKRLIKPSLSVQNARYINYCFVDLILSCLYFRNSLTLLTVSIYVVGTMYLRWLHLPLVLVFPSIKF